MIMERRGRLDRDKGGHHEVEVLFLNCAHRMTALRQYISQSYVVVNIHQRYTSMHSKLWSFPTYGSM
jgi:hypothetical protein